MTSLLWLCYRNDTERPVGIKDGKFPPISLLWGEAVGGLAAIYAESSQVLLLYWDVLFNNSFLEMHFKWVLLPSIAVLFKKNKKKGRHQFSAKIMIFIQTVLNVPLLEWLQKALKCSLFVLVPSLKSGRQASGKNKENGQNTGRRQLSPFTVTALKQKPLFISRLDS